MPKSDISAGLVNFRNTQRCVSLCSKGYHNTIEIELCQSAIVEFKSMLKPAFELFPGDPGKTWQDYGRFSPTRLTLTLLGWPVSGMTWFSSVVPDRDGSCARAAMADSIDRRWMLIASAQRIISSSTQEHQNQLVGQNPKEAWTSAWKAKAKKA